MRRKDLEKKGGEEAYQNFQLKTYDIFRSLLQGRVNTI